MSKADKLLKRVEFYEKMAQSQKSETNELLNKASLYERLAVYSDRKSFLSAIAQGMPGDIQQSETQIRNVISSVVDSVQNWIATVSERQSRLPNNLPGLPPALDAPYKTIMAANSLGAKFDVSTLPGLLQAARSLAYVGNLGNTNDDAKKAWMTNVFPKVSQLVTLLDKQIKELAAFQSNFGPEEPAEEQLEFPAGPESAPTAPPKGDGWTGPRIEAVMQTMLGVNPDGRLGPQTKAALDIYKKSRGNPAMTDAEAFALLKQEPEYRQKKAMDYDDNANVYKKSPDIVREVPF